MSQKTSKQQRASGREAARRIVDGENRARRRKSLLIKSAVVLAVLSALTATGFIIAGAAQDDIPSTGPVPDNGNVYGGIKLPAPEKRDETDLHVDLAKIPDAVAEGIPAGVLPAKEGEPVKVVVYVDPNCTHCADFDKSYGPLLEARVQDGLIDLEMRTVAFLDRASPTNYSSRAANAMSCVADWAPEKYLPFSGALFSATAAGGEQANKDLVALAEEFGVPNAGECITEGTFRPYVKFTTASAEAHGITATPSVFINGAAWELDGDLEAALPAALAPETAQ